MPVAVKPRSGAPQAQGLTAIRLAEAQLAVPFGEAPPTNPVTSLQPTPAAQVTPYHPEPPTVSAGEPYSYCDCRMGAKLDDRCHRS
jgi:hypothetical protein